MQKLKAIITFKRLLLILVVFFPVLTFGFWKKHKTYTPYFISSPEDVIGRNDSTPDSEEVDTDDDGIPDNQDSDDDNDGFDDDTEIKAGSDPLDPKSKPVDTDDDGIPDNQDSEIDKKIRMEIKNEIRSFGCDYVYHKYVVQKEVPKSYPTSHNWNNLSKFDIKDFENLIWECRKNQ